MFYIIFNLIYFMKYQNTFVPVKCTRGVVANVQDCDITVSEFELHSRYYIHFQTNTSEKMMNILIPTSHG